MKIERLSENQIRCTLSRTDLRERRISLFELAYGGEKARHLFREMLERANDEVGFRTDDLPLMIEAVPLSGEGLSLLITKVEDPEELDTRFARFAPMIEEAYENIVSAASGPENAGSAQDILDALGRILENDKSTEEEPEPGKSLPADIAPVYSFDSMENVLRAADMLGGIYRGKNSLYKNTRSGRYLLSVHRSAHTPEEFNRICNILTEYGQRTRSNAASEEYFREHLKVLADGNALQTLANTEK